MSRLRTSHRRIARGNNNGTTGDGRILIDHIDSSSFAILCNHVRPLFADKEKTMARQTTKRKVETPEGNAAVLEEIKHESGIDALRAEIDRLNWVIRQKDLTINALQKGNEEISDELSRARNDR